MLAKIHKNLLFCSFTLLSIVLLTLSINKTASYSGVTIFIISFKSSFKNTIVVEPNSYIFFWIAAFAAESVAFNPEGTKLLWTNGLSTYPIKHKP